MKEIALELVCELSEAELLDRSEQLSFAVVRQDELEIEKKNSAADYKEKIEGVGDRIRDLSAAIRHRQEKRIVRCGVLFHVPTQATKRIVRLDTGEIVKEEAMSPAECQQNMFDEQPASRQIAYGESRAADTVEFRDKRPAEQQALPAVETPAPEEEEPARTVQTYGDDPLPESAPE